MDGWIKETCHHHYTSRPCPQHTEKLVCSCRSFLSLLTFSLPGHIYQFDPEENLPASSTGTSSVFLSVLSAAVHISQPATESFECSDPIDPPSLLPNDAAFTAAACFFSALALFSEVGCIFPEKKRDSCAHSDSKVDGQAVQRV